MKPKLVAFNDVETAFDNSIRIGKLARAIQSLRDERTLVLDAGDSTAMGALAFTTDLGRGHSIPFQDLVHPDAHVPGNHDFDYGIEWLRNYAERVPGSWVATNVSNTSAFQRSTVFDVGGSTIAVIGVAHPNTPTFCAKVEELSFHDPVASIERALERLPSIDIDHIVILSHCGVLDEEIARKTDVDVIVGGHDHARNAQELNNTLVARTVGRGREVLEIELGSDPQARIHRTEKFSTDEPIATEYRQRNKAAGLDTELDTLDKELDILQTGRLIAHAYRRRTGADAGLVTEASIREPLSGDVSVGDVISVVPFGSDLVTVELSYSEWRDLLKSANRPIDETHGRAIVAGESTRNGVADREPPRPNDRYRIALMSYVTENGLLPGTTPDNIVANIGSQHEQVLRDFRENGLQIDRVFE